MGNLANYDHQRLLEVFSRARQRGLVGRESLSDAIERSLFFVKAFGSCVPRSLIDIGSGGGIPGLPLLLYWPQIRGVLLDRRPTSCAHLREATALLGIEGRVTILSTDLSRISDIEVPDQFEAVVARGVGLETLLVQGAGKLLLPGGRLVSSVPRWLSDPQELSQRFERHLPKANLDLLEILHGPLELVVFGKSG